jgi:WD40 repeat protein
MTEELQPYVGPRPFEESNRHLFFGRDGEANELMSLVVAHPAVLVYAQSGAGKTSLLNAKLIPLLKEQGYEVLPPARIQGLENEKAANIFVFNTILSWADAQNGASSELLQMTLAEFLKKRPHVQKVPDFTLKSSADDGDDEDENAAPDIWEFPRFVIFDQFEELFTSYPSQWEKRREFFDQVREALEDDYLLRVVFVMREDYIAELDPYVSLLPERLSVRVRLERLKKPAAMDAVLKPLELTVRRFDDGVANMLVDNLMKSTDGATGVEQFVEPLQLQIVCQNLWESLEPNDSIITKGHLEQCGDVKQALMRFFEKSIRSLIGENGVPDGSRRIDEGDLRLWFERVLITRERKRAIVSRERERTGDMPNDTIIAPLERMQLIKGEWRAGGRWYELSHDRFIWPILESNQNWMAEQSTAERARLRLERRATEYAGGIGGLLARDELIEAKRLIARRDAADRTPSEKLLALVSASGATEQRRRMKLLSLGVVALSAVIIAMTFLTIFAFRKSAEADEQRKEAVRLSNEALALTHATQRAREDATAKALAASISDKHAQEQEAEAKSQAAVAKREQAEASRQRTLAQHARDDAVIQEKRARSREIASMATGFFDKDPELGVQLAIEAAQVAQTDKTPNVQVQDVLRNALPLVNGKPALLKGRGGEVTSARFSRDGRYVVTTARGDNVAHLWEITDETHPEVLLADKWRQKFELRGHEFSVLSAVFSDDGKHLLTTSADRTARVWNTSTGKTIAILKGHKAPVNLAAFIPNCSFVVTASEDTTARLWEMKPEVWRSETSAEPQQPITITDSIILKGHTAGVHFLVVSSDGRLLATEAADNTGRIWNVDEIKRDIDVIRKGGAEPRSLLLENLSGPIPAMAFSSDGSKLVTEGKNVDAFVAKVWDTRSRWDKCVPEKPCLAENLFNLVGHKGAITAVNFSPNGSYIATASADETARVWDANSRVVVSELHGHEGPVSNVAFSPDSTRIVTAGFDNTARIWDVVTGRVVAVLRGHSRNLSSAVYSADNQFILTTSEDGTAGVWSASIGQKADLRAVTDLHGHAAEVFSASFSPDSGSKYALTGSWDGTARLWDINTGQGLIELDVLSPVMDSAFSPDGKLIVTASYDGVARIWDLRNQEIQANSNCSSQVWQAGDHVISKLVLSDPIMSVAFGPDDQHIVTSGWDKTARIWEEVSPGHWEEAVRLDHPSRVNSAAFSPDGGYLVTGCADGKGRVWKKGVGKHWEKIAELIGHEDTIFGVAFSSDGNYIVTASHDGTAKVWMKGASGNWTETSPFTLTGHSSYLFRASFSSDGKYIVTTSADKTARVWAKVGLNEWQFRTVLSKQAGPVYAAAFSKGNNFIITASADGLAHVYSTVMFEPFDQVWDRVLGIQPHLRPLTPLERRQYLHETDVR